MAAVSAKRDKKTKSYHRTSTCTIVVGGADEEFYVHSGLLQSTSFIAKHGPPKQKTARQIRDVQIAEQNPMFFSEEESDTTITQGNEEVVDLTGHDADYVLSDRFFHRPEAFEVFLFHLHGKTLEVPDTPDQCRILFRAYALAQEYNVPALQDAVIDVVQQYYVHHSIAISDVIWAISRFGERDACPLVMYLISQAGYEMARGWENFRRDNVEISELLGSGKAIALEHLLKACLKHGRPNSNADPAKNKKSWRLLVP